MAPLWEQPNHGDGYKWQVPVVIWTDQTWSPRFFVRMIAGFWAPSIKKSSMILSLINSQILCHLISMCLLLASVMGLDAIKMESWLSPHTGIGWRLCCHKHWMDRCNGHCMAVCLCICTGDVPALSSPPAAVLYAYLCSCCLLALVLWLVLALAIGIGSSNQI